MEMKENNLKISHEIERLERENKEKDDQLAQIREIQITRGRTEDSLTNELNEINKQIAARDDEIRKLCNTVDTYNSQIQESADFIKEAESKNTHRPLNRFLMKVDSHSGSIRGVCFGGKYNSFWTLGDDKKLIQHSLPQLREITTIYTISPPNSFRLCNDADFACVCGSDRSFRVLDTLSGRNIAESSTHNDESMDCQWISKNQILTASKDRTMKIFDLSRNSVSNTISVFSGVNSICRTESPSVFAAGCSDYSIKLVDTRTQKMALKIEKVHGRQVTCVIPSPMKDIVYSLGMDGTICATNLKNPVPKMFSITHPKLEVKVPYHKFDISPDGGYLGVGSKNGKRSK